MLFLQQSSIWGWQRSRIDVLCWSQKLSPAPLPPGEQSRTFLASSVVLPPRIIGMGIMCKRWYTFSLEYRLPIHDFASFHVLHVPNLAEVTAVVCHRAVQGLEELELRYCILYSVFYSWIYPFPSSDLCQQNSWSKTEETHRRPTGK